LSAPAITRLRDADPRGRVDVALYRVGEQIAKHVGRSDWWNGGLGEIVEAVIVESKVPTLQVMPVDIARAIGLLPSWPKRGRR
jgi:hypothetical protein